MRSANATWSVVLLLSLLVGGCGKEGPPLPPLVQLPAPPSDIAAERRGDTATLHFTIPSANTDGGRPASIERVEVYAQTGGGPAVSEDQLIEFGSRVGSVAVKTPRDPDEPGDPQKDAEQQSKPGFDQGARASVAEQLSEASDSRSPATADRSRSIEPPRVLPLAAPSAVPPSRTYAAVGVSPRGRRGPFSARAAVALVDPPPPVANVVITYDETAINVVWQALPSRSPIQAEASGDVLPATVLGWIFPKTAYHVYDVGGGNETRLTEQAIDASRFDDSRLEWGTERCYQVRVAYRFDQLAIESDGSAVQCVTPADTFPPKAPTSVQVVPSEGAISLTWQRGGEKDLAGYLVLRGTPAAALEPITPAPIPEINFTDKVMPGVPYVYAVQAVDTAGNRSAPSATSDPNQAR